jgi:hypothetical protein
MAATLTRRALVCALAAMGIACAADARVTKIEITSKESPTYGGASFGGVGQFEKLIGKVTGELDPADRHNAIIQDIELAQRNANGKVEYVATFTLVKPIDLSKANGELFYNVNNRGNRNFPYNLNGDPGDGFVQNLGYTLLWSGWQAGIPPAANNGNETITVPTAKNADGSSITGPVIYRVSNIPAGTNTISLDAIPPGGFTAFPYAVASLDTTQAALETHDKETETAVTGNVVKIAPSDWAFADCRTVPFPGTPDPRRICLRNGFDPALLYQFTFNAKDPLVMTVGLAAMRDLVSFLRYESADPAGNPNPVAGLAHALAEGTSQSGNTLKAFVHFGFNEDEKGRIVFEGINDYIAARQTPINYRFSLPGGAATLYELGSDPVLWWEDYTDAVRGRASAGMLDRCRVSNTCPKIVESFGATEFWDLRFSPGIAGTDGKADIPLPANVRRYYMPGTSHGGGAGGFNQTPGPAGGAGGTCKYAANPNPEIDTQRALFVALNQWVLFGTEPPPSRYPRVSDGTLVTATAANFPYPYLAGFTLTDDFVNTALGYDWGPGFRYNDMSGVISKEPPVVQQKIATLAPKINADGNEVVGVPSVLHQLPLGTYLGWNVVTSGFNTGRICAFTGGFIPFAKTKADRLANNDPRPSIEERYGSFTAYYYQLADAVNTAVAQRFLLRDDAVRIFRQALNDMINNSLLPKDALAHSLGFADEEE